MVTLPAGLAVVVQLVLVALPLRPVEPPSNAARAQSGAAATVDASADQPIASALDDEAAIIKEAESDPRNFSPDSFPVIRSPRYVTAGAAADLKPGEWVIGVVIAGQPLAYPVSVLNQHEIVIDTSGGVPFMVCWCPLCRTGTVFDRRMDSKDLDFGHSGKLYRDAFLLYEVGTNALWHHATGRALTGAKRGRYLKPIPCRFVKWAVWLTAYPGTQVLRKDPGNPLHAVDSYTERNRSFGLTYGLGVLVNGAHRLYPFSKLRRTNLVLENVGGVPIVVYWHRPTETAVAWRRTLEGKVLELQDAGEEANGPLLREPGPDGSVFDAVRGECVKGPLLGKRLQPVLSSFWEVFAWVNNHPHGTEYPAPSPSP